MNRNICEQSGRDDTPKPQSSLADMVVVEDEVSLGQSIPLLSWIKIAVIGLLFIKLNWWQMESLFNKYLGDDNWTHGFIIPLFSLFLMYNYRHELLAARRRVCLWGLPITVLSLLIMAAGVWPLHNNWISQLAMPLLLFGLVLYLAGPRVAWICFVPIFYLTLAMPLPGGLYNKIAYPMQEMAANMSGVLMRMFGAQVTVTASHMDIISITGVKQPLTVAEACSGVRSLMAFIALGVALAYAEERPFWQRMVMILAGIPITVICNILRVTITSTMFLINKPELGKEFMHTATGMVLLIPALLLLFGLGKLMQSFYVEEDEEEDDHEQDTAGRPTSGQEAAKT